MCTFATEIEKKQYMSIYFKQPNGLFGRFSSVVDTFTHWNCTREEFYDVVRYYLPGRDYCVEHFDEWCDGGYEFIQDKISSVDERLICELRPYNNSVKELMDMLTSMACDDKLLEYARAHLERIDKEIRSHND